MVSETRPWKTQTVTLAILVSVAVLIGPTSLVAPAVIASPAVASSARRAAPSAIVQPQLADVRSAVVPTHPRLLLTPPVLANLQAKQNANDPSWLALKARADQLATYDILPYYYLTRTNEVVNTIFYDYQGEGWQAATMPLALAYQVTHDTRYSRKLLQLADEMLAAQNRPENKDPVGLPPLAPDSYYPTRHLGPVLAVIYDWCYDQLDANRKAQLVALANTYYDELRDGAYQRNDFADGNYFVGHLVAAGWMGYATYGDNPRAQELIDHARIRFDGTPSSLIAPDYTPSSYFTQTFEGGYTPGVGLGYNGPTDVPGAPFLGGPSTIQGWAYSTGMFSSIIDYMLVVRSATGEDLFAKHAFWFPLTLRAEKHALLPDRFRIDPLGDWGSDQGALIPRSLPARLAYLLAGTADGPGAQHFATSEIAESTIPGVGVYSLSEWEDFFFSDPRRPSAELSLPPYYSAFAPVYPQTVYSATNGAIPYFIMRSDWGERATWAAIHMGAAFYDDHQHKDAGSLIINRGQDALLVDAASWKGAAGSSGVLGSSTEADNAAAANTLFFDDFGDYMYNTEDQYVGGQGNWGLDQVMADEQTGGYSYVRSDLSSAYTRVSDTSDLVNRKLDYFYRSFVYLRPANVFVVYDQVKAVTSTNPLGPYAKHLRWHVPVTPTIQAKTAIVNQGASRLFIDTLLPLSATLSAVDESHNPDHCGPGNCDSGTWRVEVRDPANPLTVPFLTILQSGPSTLAHATLSTLQSDDGTMIGAQMVQPDGTTNIVLFNNQPGQVPAPISATAYRFTGPLTATHTLAGLLPNVRYFVAYDAGRVSLAAQPGPAQGVTRTSGNVSTTAAGVLQFNLSRLGARPRQYLPVAIHEVR